MSVCLDTSVVVRLLVGLPEAQFRRARRRLDALHAEGEDVFVLDLVIAETWHALRHHYGIEEDTIRTSLRLFLASGLVRGEPPGVETALEKSGSAGLVDRLIHLRCAGHPATLLTFDRQQARLGGVELLQ